MADSANMTNLVLTKGALTAEVIPATAEEELTVQLLLERLPASKPRGGQI